MKKLFLLIVVTLLCAWSGSAQVEQGEMAVGGGLTVGFGDSYTNVGIGAKYQYNVITRVRLEPAVNYYFKKDYMSMWDAGVNVHYLLTPANRWLVYPIVGIGVVGAKINYGDAMDDVGGEILGDKYEDYEGALKDYLDGYDDSLTNFFVHVGLGAEYMVSNTVSVNLEYKYKICQDLNRSLLTLGVAYHF